MSSRLPRYPVVLAFIGVLLAADQARAQSDPRDRSDAAKQTAATTAQRNARSTAKGPLPDPLLLDGSTQPAEKRSEQGMLGEFEIPGDENARGGKVGGQQQPPGQKGSAGGQQMPMGMPQAGGGAQGQQSQQPPGAQGAQGGAQGAQGGAQANAEKPDGKAGGAGGSTGVSDPNAKAEGAQVGQLNAGEEGGAQPEVGPKPSQVAIGDSAMQIKGAANAPGVVGAAQSAATNTQQMEKKIGSAGGSGGSGSPAPAGGRNAAEKGRAMPAGL